MSLDKATVRRIATLGRIEVPDADLEHLASELSHILERQVGSALRQRPDAPRPDRFVAAPAVTGPL